MNEIATVYLVFLLLVILTVIGLCLAGIVLIAISQERRYGYPRCGECGYDLTGSNCPECGSTFGLTGVAGSRKPSQPGFRSFGIALIGLAIVILALSGLLAT